MKIAAICCTYKRPSELATAIECFLRQDYPAELREMIVLDDAGQYESQHGDGWRLVSVPFRFRTLGEKRNASAALERVNGYPFIQSGQDQGLLRRFKSAKLRRGDPIQHDSRPSYVYRWYTAHSQHLSPWIVEGVTGSYLNSWSAQDTLAAIDRALQLDRTAVREFALHRFDPERIVKVIIEALDAIRKEVHHEPTTVE